MSKQWPIYWQIRVAFVTLATVLAGLFLGAPFPLPVTLICAVAVTAAGTHLTCRALCRPIDRLGRAAEAIADGQHDTALEPLNTGDDLARLARALEKLRDQGIQQAEAGARLRVLRKSQGTLIARMKSELAQLEDDAIGQQIKDGLDQLTARIAPTGKLDTPPVDDPRHPWPEGAAPLAILARNPSSGYDIQHRPSPLAPAQDPPHGDDTPFRPTFWP